jgi:hypothetical protein
MPAAAASTSRQLDRSRFFFLCLPLSLSLSHTLSLSWPVPISPPCARRAAAPLVELRQRTAGTSGAHAPLPLYRGICTGTRPVGRRRSVSPRGPALDWALLCRQGDLAVLGQGAARAPATGGSTHTRTHGSSGATFPFLSCPFLSFRVVFVLSVRSLVSASLVSGSVAPRHQKRDSLANRRAEHTPPC